MEGTDTLGTLLGAALLSLDRIPAKFLHVSDDSGGVGVNVLAGDSRIGSVLGESIRTNRHDLFVGHRSHLIGERNHCTHFFFFFVCIAKIQQFILRRGSLAL
jgi:hypothetical protein